MYTKTYEFWKAPKLKHITHNNLCAIIYYDIIHHLFQD